MNCCITELRCKEVINAKNGCRIGQVSDVEIDTCSGCIVSLIIWGRPKCFGLFGREDDIRIKWNEIEVIGDDTILICGDCECCNNARTKGKRNGMESFFRL